MYEYLDRRYAQALYDVAESKGNVAKYINDLIEIDNMIDNNPKVANVIKHPEISTKEKKKFFISLLKGKVDEDLLTFILLLIEKDRILFLKEKIRELRKIDFEHRNIKVARITVTTPLSEVQKVKLIEQLEKKYEMNIILDETIDEKILGGIIIKIDEDLIDGSVRTKLEDVKNSLLERLR